MYARLTCINMRRYDDNFCVDTLRFYIYREDCGKLAMMTFPKWRKVAELMMLDGKVIKILCL